MMICDKSSSAVGSVLVNSLIVATLLFQTSLLFYNGSIVRRALDVGLRSPLFPTIVCTDGVPETVEGNKLRKMLRPRQSQMPKLAPEP